MAPPLIPNPSPSHPAGRRGAPRFGRRGRLAAVLAVFLVVVLGAAATQLPHAVGAAKDSVTVLGPDAGSLDPAVQADAGSAQVVSQLFESLTAVDVSQRVQPALAASWEALDGGKRVVFHLRDGLVFSDGSPLRAGDVVTSWLRLLAPAHPSQLASLLDDVTGATDYREGRGDRSKVGLRAPDDRTVEVDLVGPAADFPAIASSPSLAVVPPAIDRSPEVLDPGSFVGSGGYVLSARTKSELTLVANARYWAGTPPIKTIHLLTSIGGKDPLDEFNAGRLDYTPIATFNGSWIAYDAKLGPALRRESSPETSYYGFDTSRAPFDNVHVRRAFALGVDWRRLASLVGPTIEPATSMVPPGLPGRSDGDFGPKYDLPQARSELAAAGFPDGKGFPKVTLVTTGGPLDDGLVAELRKNLGIELGYEALDWESYNERLLTDPPAMWSMGWIADYPGANDFLGLLLGSGKANNYGRWHSPEFDAAIAKALSASDPNAMRAAFDEAQAIVQRDAPVIPVAYSAGYTLARNGLLGAAPNGQGLVRYAGLGWQG